MLFANEHNARIIKAVLCAGFYPNVVRVKHPEAKYAESAGGAILKASAPSLTRVHLMSTRAAVKRFKWVQY